MKRSETIQKNGVSTHTILFMTAVTALTVFFLILDLPQAYGLFFPQDEFGYWGNAATMLGWDWEAIRRTQASYAYGYSLLLLPMLKLFSSPAFMYRAAVILNAVFYLLYAFLFLRFANRIAGKVDEKKRTLIALVSVLLPAIPVYVHYTIAETLLSLLFICLCHSVLSVTETKCAPKAFLPGLFFALCMLLVHYRTIGIFAAYLLVCAVVFFGIEPFSFVKKHVRIFVIVGILFLIALAVFLYTGDPVSGLGRGFGRYLGLLIGFAGKVFYIGVAGFGISILGLPALFEDRKNNFSLFLLTGLVAELFIGSYFFADGFRIDQIVYGRYTEMFLPVLLFFGFLYLFKEQNAQELLRVIVFLGVLAVILTAYIYFRGIREYAPDFVSGIDWVFFGSMPTVFFAYEKPFLISAFVFALLFFLIRQKYDTAALLLTLALFTGILAFSFKDHVYDSHVRDRSDYQLAQKIEAFEEEGRELTFITFPYNEYINLMQFWRQEKPVRVIERDQWRASSVTEKTMILTYPNLEYSDEIEEAYRNKDVSAHFILYYN